MTKCIANRGVWKALAMWGCLIAGTSRVYGQPSVQPQRPNIIVILADDLGYGDIRAYQADSQIPTPHLDRLSEAGIRFTDAHSGSSVCSPTRYGLLTGRYAFRSPLKKGVLGGYSPPLIEHDRATLGTLLKSAGYQTAVIGKWHLGLQWQHSTAPEPLSWDQWPSGEGINPAERLTSGPNQLGFDYSYIIPASLDIPPYVYYENGVPTDPSVVTLTGRNEPRGVFWRTGAAASSFDLHQTLDVLTEQALTYLHHAISAEEPYFLYFPLTSPHTPWLPDEPFIGVSNAGLYGDFVAHTDAVVGRILELLDRTGTAENTVVVFTSDNGADWKPIDSETYPAHRANGPFKGQKSDIFEGGHRVPFVVRWPAVVEAGRQSDQLVVLTDLFATLAAVSGATIPDGAAEDSFDFSSVLLGTQPVQGLRNTAIHHSVEGMFAIRRGTWKYIAGLGSGGWTETPIETNALITDQLYRLSEDPVEATNQVLERPEIAEELRALLKDIVSGARR